MPTAPGIGGLFSTAACAVFDVTVPAANAPAEANLIKFLLFTVIPPVNRGAQRGFSQRFGAPIHGAFAGDQAHVPSSS